MNEINLKPCPFCGSNNLKLYTFERNDIPKYKWRTHVVCLECFGGTVNHDLDCTENESRDNAIKAWNRRGDKQNERKQM